MINKDNEDDYIANLLTQSDSSLTENDLIIKRNIEDRHRMTPNNIRARMRGRRKLPHLKCPNEIKGNLKRLKLNNKTTDYLLCDSCERIVYFAQKEVIIEE